MIEKKGDLFQNVFDKDHTIAISTNGCVKQNGLAVMGRGCAFEATLLYASLPKLLGQSIRQKGNVPCYIQTTAFSDGLATKFMILPVKHNWWEKASLDLVNVSIEFLISEATAHPEITFHVPRLGCGNGRLDWITQVKPYMEDCPANVVVHH
jgi:hypothetical protein